MNAARPVTIVGGGLAGLALGLALRRRDVPVVLHEAGGYPRHRVCGEFINGRGRDLLRALDVERALLAGGAREAHDALFVAERARGRVQRLPEPALCVSRWTLDAHLADALREAGGDVREGSRRDDRSARGSAQAVAPPADGATEGIVLATGRRLAPPGEARFYGLKAHASDVALDADLELHLRPDGYVGLCRLADGLVNVCALLRVHRAHDGRLASPPDVDPRVDALRGAPGSVLHARLRGARFVPESVCAVAGLDLRPRRAAADERLRVGDALTMIPPFTGNGMSMAFESAALAVDPLAAWSLEGRGWDETRREVAARCDAAFGRRLLWARRLQDVLGVAWLQPWLVRALARPGWTFRALAQRTR